MTSNNENGMSDFNARQSNRVRALQGATKAVQAVRDVPTKIKKNKNMILGAILGTAAVCAVTTLYLQDKQQEQIEQSFAEEKEKIEWLVNKRDLDHAIASAESFREAFPSSVLPEHIQSELFTLQSDLGCMRAKEMVKPMLALENKYQSCVASNFMYVGETFNDARWAIVTGNKNGWYLPESARARLRFMGDAEFAECLDSKYDRHDAWKPIVETWAEGAYSSQEAKGMLERAFKSFQNRFEYTAISDMLKKVLETRMYDIALLDSAEYRKYDSLFIHNSAAQDALYNEVMLTHDVNRKIKLGEEYLQNFREASDTKDIAGTILTTRAQDIAGGFGRVLEDDPNSEGYLNAYAEGIVLFARDLQAYAGKGIAFKKEHLDHAIQMIDRYNATFKTHYQQPSGFEHWPNALRDAYKQFVEFKPRLKSVQK